MKIVKLFLLLLAGLPLQAQVKSTGTIALGSSMSIKLDLNNATSQVTMTLTGPSTRWFGIAFCGTASTAKMSTSVDCVLINSATTIKDYKALGGHNNPVADTQQDWTLVSNTVSGTTRTVVATRALNTGDANDFAFNFASMVTTKIIWAYAASAAYTFSGDHGGNKGTKTLTFTTLGLPDVPSLETLTVAPNPSAGAFSISNPDNLEVTSIRVFDVNARVVSEMEAKIENGSIAVDLTGLSAGSYYLELSNGYQTSVKRIEIK